MKAPVFFALATSLLVADESRPRELSDAQLLALATDSAPVGHKLEQRTKQHQPVSESMEQQRKKADALLAQFADDVEDSALQNLIQNQEKQPSPPQAQNAIPKPSLEVQCDAGAFFDGEENLLVFLRNIIVTEERFKLKAAKELKLYFQDAPEAEKPADLDVDEAANPADLDIPSVEMGDIDRLIATGGVQVTGVDKEGNPFETRAETASYDAKTQLLILKGGRPYFFRKKGDAQFALEARTPDAYVQIDLSGEKIQADTSRTGWGFAADGLRQQN